MPVAELRPPSPPSQAGQPRATTSRRGARRTRVRAIRAMLAAVLFMVPIIGGAVPAHAAEDVVRSMDVTYDVRADGTVQVRQQLDWRFGSRDSHGILLGITTREPWDGEDPQPTASTDAAEGYDVVYEVSNIAVESPTGAPATFTHETSGGGSEEQIDLRIGDPDETVGKRNHTYVITYDLAGALRTFDGLPELNWDVTSSNFPPIEEYTVRINAPDGVTRARCLIGEYECNTRVEDGQAILSGSDAPSGSTLTAVGRLRPDAVSDAEPILEPRRREFETILDLEARTTVRPDATTHVEQDLTVLPASGEEDLSLSWTVPIRMPWSDEQDMVTSISRATALVDGQPVPVEEANPIGDGSWQQMDLRVDVPHDDLGDSEPVEVSLAYDVAGAVVVEGDRAELRWPMTAYTTSSDDGPVTATWQMPGPVSTAQCVEDSPYQREAWVCGYGRALMFDVAGDQVTFEEADDESVGSTWNVHMRFPAASVTGGSAVLEPSLDRAASQRQALSVGAGAGGAVLAGLLGWLLTRLLTPADRRYANEIPGNRPAGDASVAPVVAARGRRKPAVRFHPPDVSLLVAATIWRRGYHPTVFAALLVEQAVNKVLKLTSDPPAVTRRGSADRGDSLGRELRRAAPREAPGVHAEMDTFWERIRNVVVRHVARVSEDEHYFMGGEYGLDRPKWAWMATVALTVVGWVPLAALLGRWIAPNGWIVAAAVLGALVIGVSLGVVRANKRAPLTADGTVIREQTEAFRQYIATAEADQLRFEAGEDIFSRYLPWAVLFGLEDRWAKVCEEAARMGRIPEPDTSYFSDGIRVGALGSAVSDFSREARSGGRIPSSSGDSSSGGSGGSSGFSSSSSGGSGGGGTSASSW